MATGRVGRAAAQALSAATTRAGRRPERARLIEREAGHVIGNGREADSSRRRTARRG